jgi:hypothetical protein
VIPTILVASLIVGRWLAIPASAVVWSVLLLATGTIVAADIPGAATLAASNAAAGVVLHQAARAAFRSVRLLRR